MGSRLRGKTALVTGATSNIGRAIATVFAAEGARVVVSGRNRERGTSVAERIREAGGSADFVGADLDGSDLDGSAAASHGLAAEATQVLGGRIDVLVNNAGIFPTDNALETDESTLDEVYAVNVDGGYRAGHG